MVNKLSGKWRVCVVVCRDDQKGCTKLVIVPPHELFEPAYRAMHPGEPPPFPESCEHEFELTSDEEVSSIEGIYREIRSLEPGVYPHHLTRLLQSVYRHAYIQGGFDVGRKMVEHIPRPRGLRGF